MREPSLDAAALQQRLLSSIPVEARDAVQAIVASARPASCYVVAGAVRDVLLERPIVDIDLAVEADGIIVSRRALPGARITTHARFRTATANVGGMRIDVATSRCEHYQRPGALPRIEPCDIASDLARRDFSVNAIALALGAAPVLIDTCGGLADLRAGVLRVLHDASFRDDATRIMRVHRYAARLGFSIAATTAAAITRDVHYVETIGGERLRREFELILGEPAAAAALRGLDADNALAAVHPRLSWDGACSHALSASALPARQRVELGFSLLARNATEAEAAAIILRLRLKRAQAAAVMAMPHLNRMIEMLARDSAKPSGVALLLDRHPEPAIEALAGTSPNAIARAVCLRYLAEWRRLRTFINGRDVQRLGVAAGPRVAQALQLARAARLDGWATTRDDELGIVERFAASIRDAGRANMNIDLDFDGD